MPASFTAERKAATGTTATTTFAFSPASNCTAGSTIILCIGLFLSTGPVTVVSVADTKSNTWVVDLTTTANGKGGTTICSSYQASALLTSDTVTVTISTSAASISWAVWLEEFGGNYSTKDVSANSTGSNSTALPTGTTAATADADEFVVAGYGANASGAITKNASYTVFTTGQQTVGGGQGLYCYRILSATGTQNADGTDASMVTSANGIATYKIVVSAVFIAPAEKVILQAVNRAATF